jgi:hypothetical protein
VISALGGIRLKRGLRFAASSSARQGAPYVLAYALRAEMGEWVHDRSAWEAWAQPVVRWLVTSPSTWTSPQARLDRARKKNRTHQRGHARGTAHRNQALCDTSLHALIPHAPQPSSRIIADAHGEKRQPVRADVKLCSLAVGGMYANVCPGCTVRVHMHQHRKRREALRWLHMHGCART